MSAVDVAALSALYLSETGFERSEFQLRLRQYRFWHEPDQPDRSDDRGNPDVAFQGRQNWF